MPMPTLARLFISIDSFILLMRWRFKCGKVVGYILKGEKSGAIVHIKKFKAWCSCLTLRKMLKENWKYVVLVAKKDNAEKSAPVGTIYLSRDGRFFYLRSKQHNIACMGWSDNLAKMLHGQAKRVPVHTRLKRKDGAEA